MPLFTFQTTKGQTFGIEGTENGTRYFIPKGGGKEFAQSMEIRRKVEAGYEQETISIQG